LIVLQLNPRPAKKPPRELLLIQTMSSQIHLMPHPSC
jgi:hypothetical protein